MRHIWVIFLLVFFGPKLVAASGRDSLRGIVFQDKNLNGFRDQGEPGIEGVCVSNGKDVVLTSQAGEWTLSAEDVNSVFVIKPANYAVPLNEVNIPQHFVLTENLPVDSGVHFALRYAPEPNTFSTLFFGDTQARGLREVNFVMHDVVEECMETDAAFGVSLGDIVADDPTLFAEVSQGIGQIGIPWYNIFGNHDHDRDETENINKDKTFRSHFGPSTYAFEYGQVVFIGLNNIYFNPGGKYTSHLEEGQLDFVRNYLEYVPEEKLVVLMMHAPVIRTENRDILYEILAGRRHTFSISGHVHEQINVFVDTAMGWKGSEPHHHLINATVCGSWWCGLHDELGIPHATMNDGAPNGYSIITFSGNQYSIRYKAARRPVDYQMNIYMPDEITTQELDTASVLVNIFAGSARSLVEMRIGRNGNWNSMEQVSAVDPACLRMHQLSPVLETKLNGESLEQAFGYKMDYPSVSTHMWKAKLPAGLAEGTHTITIRTTDMFNQTWTGNRIFRVRSGKSTL